ncbi:hypothetical protein YPPY53_4600, partial [Yersinia pestis PY-53]|jgi:hypothetical protein
MHY